MLLSKNVGTMYDLVVKDGVIVDGTRNPWFKADVGISEGKIVKISRVQVKGAKRYLDAKGMIVAPGFVDTHAHSDFTVIKHNMAESVIADGITTQGVGNCGLTVFPVTPKNREFVQTWMLDFGDDETKVNWVSLAEWRKLVESRGIGSNLVPYVGHNTLRTAVMGEEGKGGERCEPTTGEMTEMKNRLDQAMREGAFGLSSGLVFPPGRNALTQELIDLCKVIAKYGGFYTSHMRDTTDRCIEAAMEFIGICEKGGVRGFMSHLYSGFSWNHGKPIAILRLIRNARKTGLDITFDFIPYAPLVGGCFLGVQVAYIPAITFGTLSRKQLLEDLSDPKKWKQIKNKILQTIEKERLAALERGKELQKRGHPYGFSENEIHLIPHLKFMIAFSRTRPDLQGKNLEEATNLMGKSDYLEFARDLYLADEGYTTCGGNNISEEDVMAMVHDPVGSICTDTWQIDFSKFSWSMMVEKLQWLQTPHSWAHSHFLEKYVKEKKTLALEDAIQKMTSLPASKLNLKDRGTLREGNWADVTIFDMEDIKSNATWANPTLYPSGIKYVLVNGQIVLDKGKHTGALPGKVLCNWP